MRFQLGIRGACLSNDRVFMGFKFVHRLVLTLNHMQAEVNFVLHGKTRVISNLPGLFLNHMLQLCQFRVGGGVLYFAQLSMTFVVYSMKNSRIHARKND